MGHPANRTAWESPSGLALASDLLEEDLGLGVFRCVPSVAPEGSDVTDASLA